MVMLPGEVLFSLQIWGSTVSPLRVPDAAWSLALTAASLSRISSGSPPFCPVARQATAGQPGLSVIEECPRGDEAAFRCKDALRGRPEGPKGGSGHAGTLPQRFFGRSM